MVTWHMSLSPPTHQVPAMQDGDLYGWGVTVFWVHCVCAHSKSVQAGPGLIIIIIVN